MAIMAYAKFHFNRLMGIRASESPPAPPGPGERLKRLGLKGLSEILAVLPQTLTKYG